MKLTVLGNWGACPQAGEATAGLLLCVEDRVFLIDCGSGVLAQSGKFCSVGDFEAVFLSHYHHDHCADIGCLQYGSKFAFIYGLRREPLLIYGHDQSPRFEDLTYGSFAFGYAVGPDTTVERDGLRVSFAQTAHEQYNLAMRFEYGNESLVYTGDMGPRSDIVDFCAGADLLVCECCFLESEADDSLGHMSTRDVGTLAQKAGVRRVMLTHFPHGAEGAIWENDPKRTRELRERMAGEVRRYYDGPVLISKIGESYQLTVES
ncbi:MAG: MBL fold metallo-hydrolase [Peptococcaceae bacterium]|nr:MBL fold metallo-hydrolase [Peptococcaceae bacterium]